MENDTIVEQVTETIQDTTAVNSMVDGVKKLASTPVSDWLPDYFGCGCGLPFGPMDYQADSEMDGQWIDEPPWRCHLA